MSDTDKESPVDGIAGHTLLAEFPMVCCPHCGVLQQWDDCHELDAGSSRNCCKCEKEIHVLSVYAVFYARLSTTKS